MDPTPTYMINGLHGKIKGHKLANGLQSIHRRTSGNASKPCLRNRSIDNSLGAEFLQESTAYLKNNE